MMEAAARVSFSSRGLRLFGAAVSLVVLSLGCMSSNRLAGQHDSNQPEPVPHSVVDAYAEQFIAAVRSPEPLSVTDLLEWDRILKNASGGASLTAAQLAAFQHGARSSCEKNGLAAELRELQARGGAVEYVRARDDGDETRAIFRLTEADGGGLNYLEVVVHPDTGEAGCRGIDVFNYLSGQRLSERVKQIVLMTTDASGKLAMTANGEGDEETANLDYFVELSNAAAKNDDRKVIELFKALPDSLKSDRSLLLMFIRACGRRNERDYVSALKFFQYKHGDDRSLDMLLFDAHFVSQRFDEALESLDRLEAAVGRDSQLDVLRASVYIAQRDFDSAKTSIDGVIEKLPDMEHAYWVAATISLRARKFGETTRLLDRIRQRFDADTTDLTKLAEYSEYVASPEYKSWVNARLKKLAKQDPEEITDAEPPASEAGA